jgi:hypothetical protein
MMASFTAKLGSYDFAQYVRVGPGEGMDPYGGAFEDPIFQDVSIAEGQPLLGVDVKNSEKVWPLYLNSSSKDALHNLIRDLGREIRYGNQPQRLEWKDSGASNSTFYDVARARFEPSFSFRQSEHGWFAGNLHVWCQPPYGHTATERIVSTALAATGIAIATVPALAGDMAALAQYTVTTSGAPVGPGGRVVAVARMPNTSYQSFWPPASLGLLGGALLAGASGAPASQSVGLPSVGLLTDDGIPLRVGAAVRVGLGAEYAGRNRILAAVRPGRLSGMAAWAHDDAGHQLGPTAVARAYNSGFMLADLGAVSVSTAIPTTVFTVGIGQLPQLDDDTLANLALSGPPAGELGGLFIFPEDSSAVLVDELVETVAGRWFAASGAAASAAFTSDDYGNVPDVAALGAASMYINASGLQSGAAGAPQSVVVAMPAVEPHTGMRARFACKMVANPPVGSPAFLAVGREGDNSSVLGVVESHASVPRMYITAVNAQQNLRASAFLPLGPTGAFWTSPTRLLLGEVVTRGEQAYFTLRVTNGAGIPIFNGGTWGVGATTVPVACVGLPSSFVRQARGTPKLVIGGSGGLISVYHWQHDRVTGFSTASDSYLLDGVLDQALVTTPSYGVQDRTAGLRGRIPQQNPSGGRLTAFDAQLDGGPMNDPMSVSIAVRERFTFAR